MSESKIKIVFVLPSLKAGGAERVISFIATNLESQKFKSILIIVGNQQDAVYDTQGIEVHFLNKKRVLNAIPKLFKYLFFNKPAIVVGSISHVNRVLAMLSLFFPKTKFVGREASVSSIMKTFAMTHRKTHIPFFRNYHKYLEAIICQSEDMVEDLVTNYGFSKTKIHVINNPITGHLPIKEPHSSKEKTKQLITIGRLSKEKGHERILKVLSKLEFDYCYTVIGTGIEKDTIFNLAKQLNIFDKIKYVPHTNDVAHYLSNSDVFIQGSYVEGFPNALLESCVVGTPVIAFNAPGGTKEIIEDNVNGFMVDTNEAFIEKIDFILNKKEWNPKLINASVAKKYDKNFILKKYEALFFKLSIEQQK
ncbi:MAG: glycosyltransferase [Gelidibacter sp.]